jgi:hypothetical protein
VRVYLQADYPRDLECHKQGADGSSSLRAQSAAKAARRVIASFSALRLDYERLTVSRGPSEGDAMSYKKILLPAAALLLVGSFLASRAGAQTMGEYATTTASSTSAPMSTDFAAPQGDNGGSSRTWGVSALGSSWSDRAGAASGLGQATDFASRASAMTQGSATAAGERWPQTGISSAKSSFDNASSDRFSEQGGSQDRFPSRDLSSDCRWPASSFPDNKGLDSTFNTLSGN